MSPRIPEAVLQSLPDETAEVILRTALRVHLRDGSSETLAFIKAYRALEEAGYEADGDSWVRKDAPTVGDVHVNSPIGAIGPVAQGKKKKPRSKDDPGTQDVDADDAGALGLTTPAQEDDVTKIIRQEGSQWHVYSEEGSKHLGGPYGTKAEAVERLRQVEGHKDKVGKEDVITVNVPLFLKLLEAAREEIKTDEPLHVITERILELMAKKPELTMDDYDSIVGELKQKREEDKDDDPGTQDVDPPELVGDVSSPLTSKISKGGEGSGNFGHEGRPGELGGSGSGGRSSSAEKLVSLKEKAIADSKSLVTYGGGKAFPKGEGSAKEGRFEVRVVPKGRPSVGQSSADSFRIDHYLDGKRVSRDALLSAMGGESNKADIDVAKRISGNSSIKLNAKGKALADKLGERLALKGGLDVLHTSPLPRAVETGDALAKHVPEVARALPSPALQPWHLGEAEGKQPDEVHNLIAHYVENPGEVIPGEGRDGKPGEAFEDAVTRQLDFLRGVYHDSEEHPNLKIGIVMHSRGMELLQSWVDAGCPKDYMDLDADDLLYPDDPNHATVLRWHGDKIKEVGLEGDDELKPGVYLILHSLTDDDTDEGNEELEKANDEHWVTINGNKVLIGADGEIKAGHPLGGGASKEPATISDGETARLRHEVVQQPTRSLISSYKKESEKTFLDWNDNPVVETVISHPLDRSLGVHLDRIDNLEGNKGKGYAGEVLSYSFGKLAEQGYTFGRAYVENGNASSERMIEKLGGYVIATRPEGHEYEFPLKVIKLEKRAKPPNLHVVSLDERKEAIQKTYLPPVEVHQAAKSAYDLGASIIGITEPLSDGTGLHEQEVRWISEWWATVESGSITPTALQQDAWGGKHAAKWAGRVIRKIEVEKAEQGDEWVTINGNHVLIGADGEIKGGHPLGGGAGVDYKPSERMKRAMAAHSGGDLKSQRQADEQERIISKAIGIPRTKDNSAFDLRSDKVGIELKTMTLAKNSKITMTKTALARKNAEIKSDKIKAYTVVADKRSGGTQYYIKAGVGSFRVGSMTRASLSEIKSMVKP